MAGLDHLHRLRVPGLHVVVYNLEERDNQYESFCNGRISCTAVTITIEISSFEYVSEESNSPKRSTEFTLDSSLESLDMMFFLSSKRVYRHCYTNYNQDCKYVFGLCVTSS